MTTSLALFLALTGLTGGAIGLLALGMPRHHAAAFGYLAGIPRRRGFRFTGWFFLTASLLVALSAGDGGVSLLTWFALLSTQGFAVAMLLAYAPRAVPWWNGLSWVLAALTGVGMNTW